MTERVSWLRRTRIAADFASDAALARAISAKGATVDQWGRSSRTPSWCWIEPLASALRLSPSEVVVGLWEETPGDPCDCGCGGEKVFPLNPSARRLLIRLPCVKCGRPRLLQQSDSHPRLCNAHHQTVGERVARTTFSCVGYHDHGTIRHAHRCRREARFTPGEISAHMKAEKGRQGPQPFFLREATGTFRSRECATAVRVLAMMDQQLYEHTKKRVRSPAGRIKALQVHVIGEDLSPVPAWEEIRPGFAQAVRSEEGRSRPRPGRVMSEIDRHTTSKAIIAAKWATGAPSSIAISLCLLPDCRKVVLTGRQEGRSPTWHLPCRQEWSRTREMRHWKSELVRGHKRPQPLPAAEPWRPVELDNLRRDFAWAIQHYLGDPDRYSYRQIAERERFSFSTVRDAIKGITDRLPEPELVPRVFRQHIEFLLEAISART